MGRAPEIEWDVSGAGRPLGRVTYVAMPEMFWHDYLVTMVPEYESLHGAMASLGLRFDELVFVGTSDVNRGQTVTGCMEAEGARLVRDLVTIRGLTNRIRRPTLAARLLGWIKSKL